MKQEVHFIPTPRRSFVRRNFHIRGMIMMMRCWGIAIPIEHLSDRINKGNRRGWMKRNLWHLHNQISLLNNADDVNGNETANGQWMRSKTVFPSMLSLVVFFLSRHQVFFSSPFFMFCSCVFKSLHFEMIHSVMLFYHIPHSASISLLLHTRRFVFTFFSIALFALAPPVCVFIRLLTFITYHHHSHLFRFLINSVHMSVEKIEKHKFFKYYLEQCFDFSELNVNVNAYICDIRYGKCRAIKVFLRYRIFWMMN